MAKLSNMASCDAQKTVANTIPRNNQQDVAGTQLSVLLKLEDNFQLGRVFLFVFFLFGNLCPEG